MLRAGLWGLQLRAVSLRCSASVVKAALPLLEHLLSSSSSSSGSGSGSGSGCGCGCGSGRCTSICNSSSSIRPCFSASSSSITSGPPQSCCVVDITTSCNRWQAQDVISPSARPFSTASAQAHTSAPLGELLAGLNTNAGHAHPTVSQLLTRDGSPLLYRTDQYILTKPGRIGVPVYLFADKRPQGGDQLPVQVAVVVHDAASSVQRYIISKPHTPRHALLSSAIRALQAGTAGGQCLGPFAAVLKSGMVATGNEPGQMYLRNMQHDKALAPYCQGGHSLVLLE